MTDQLPVYATACIILGLGLCQLLRKRHDPFEPIWLFLAGYLQIYVIQAISYRDYALRARGIDVVTTANVRALWALGLFLVVYLSGLGRVFASWLPRAPERWSRGLALGLAPPLLVWGAVCSGLLLSGPRQEVMTEEENLLRQFPVFMLEAGVLLIVTGRQRERQSTALSVVGLATSLSYMIVWTFNGKRSHALVGLLASVCAWYLPRLRRPSLPMLGVTGLACAMVVSLALGWRSNYRYERSPAGFVQYLSEFDPAAILVNLNMKEREEVDPDFKPQESKETEEYGGFLLMVDTVPEKSGHDYGASYLRIFTTYIPRILWPDKPLYGREEWISAWIAGSEMKRDRTFSGPSIGILGAAQLNGGATGTAILMTVAALVLRTAYEYFRRYADCPWAQVWWSMTFFNAWMMVATDDPLVFFYYMYGHTILPPMAFLWLANRLGGRGG
jgi:hypothetical protein